MNNSALKAFKHFAGNRNFQATPLGKIQLLAAAYPYFPVAQFFLAKKMKEEQDENYIAQSHKAVLYFYNPFMFDHLINSDALQKSSIEDGEETMATTGQHEIFSTEEEVNEETFREAENIKSANSADNTSATQQSIFQTENSASAFIEIDENGNAAHKTEKVIEEEPDEHERMFRSIKAMLDASTEEADADVDNTEIPIDPYYTVDYFASQGIKLEFEVNPQDKLGQNLKKFTHWLRHMKKLGPEDAKVELENNVSEADVQKLADTSNNAKEVVTEAMASVLGKQGKKEKAIELYTKLSFLNPDKSAYFAAQIEKLKGL